ncbi:hypothetical protein [Brevundimonas sp.]|uniref:hypothetical protein n=1 Tax=Brevundimonas sp. TaxID=1871086 RepID=UPI00257F43AB|nr:hypothetical protein [Brevundimonas sp.]
MLASQSPAAGAPAILYACPPGKIAVVSINVCNRSSNLARISLGLRNGADAIAPGDWIEFSTPIAAAGSGAGAVMERTGLVLRGGDRLWAFTDLAGVNFHVWGLLEDDA